LNAKFRTNKKIIFFLFFFLEFIKARYNEIPIKKNKIVHTIGNTKFGGVIVGLI